MGMEGFPAERTHVFQAPIKLAQPFAAPELQPKHFTDKRLFQRTPWGGGKKKGVENLTNDTPPKKGFWTPPSYSTFSTPLGCQCSVFPVQNSTTEQTRSSFGGVQKFSGERVLRYVFLPPYVLHPPISRPNARESLW